MNTRIITYNSRGLPKHCNKLYQRPTIINLFEQCDILCVQETWYTKQDLKLLNSLHCDFHGTGSATIDLCDKLYQGHPPGGVAILWRNSLDKYIEPLNYEYDWITGVTLILENKKIAILCVYMPCMNSADNREDEYLENLAVISSLIEELDCTCVQIYGDWNADCSNSCHKFGNFVKQFCSDSGLVLSSEALLPADSFTFKSDCWHTTSWIDHCISSRDGHDTIIDMKILYDESIGDHIPVKCTIATNLIPVTEKFNNYCALKLKWDRLNKEDIDNYLHESENCLKNVNIPLGTICCKNANCQNDDHTEDLNVFYNSITESLLNSSCQAFSNVLGKKNFKCRPGWTDFVQDLHKCAREFFVMWCDAGKPKQGQIFKLMLTTKARFKYSLRFIKQHENRLQSESLANSMSNENPEIFWKEVKKMNRVKTPLPNNINGVSGKNEITEVWRKHFSDLLNCIQDNVDDVTQGKIINDCISVSVHDIEDAIKKLVNNKSCGMDGIYAEHLKYCSKRILPLLALCIQGCFVHGFLPSNMMSVVLVPIIKDKTGKINDKDNYRPIALASVVSKVIELIILDRLYDVLITNSNQFGFKQKLGTDMCIYSLKEIIDRYRQLQGTVFMCFLDASKAFDRVKHSVLFTKLLKRGAPIYIVRLLVYWYSHQTMYVRWGGAMSTPFSVTNGVRQGGILSPYLFNVYMDGLSDNLNVSKYGCIAGPSTVNHLMYADDLVLFCPSAIGLKELLRICEIYGDMHEIKFNSKKSAIMICRSKYTKEVNFAPFTIKGECIKHVSFVKYLGHIISEDTKDDRDIFRQCRMLYAQGNMLTRKFHMCSNNVKIKLFRTFCSPMYTSQLWWNYKKMSINKLYVAYNNAFRMLLKLQRDCSSSGMFVNNNVNTCPAVIRNLVYRFMNRIEVSGNYIVKSVLTSDMRWQSRIRLHWMKLLYVHF